MVSSRHQNVDNFVALTFITKVIKAKFLIIQDGIFNPVVISCAHYHQLKQFSMWKCIYIFVKKWLNTRCCWWVIRLRWLSNRLTMGTGKLPTLRLFKNLCSDADLGNSFNSTSLCNARVDVPEWLWPSPLGRADVPDGRVQLRGACDWQPRSQAHHEYSLHILQLWAYRQRCLQVFQ